MVRAIYFSICTRYYLFTSYIQQNFIMVIKGNQRMFFNYSKSKKKNDDYMKLFLKDQNWVKEWIKQSC